jgi:hypothetical protein
VPAPGNTLHKAQWGTRTFLRQGQGGLPLAGGIGASSPPQTLQSLAFPCMDPRYGIREIRSGTGGTARKSAPIVPVALPVRPNPLPSGPSEAPELRVRAFLPARPGLAR